MPLLLALVAGIAGGGGVGSAVTGRSAGAEVQALRIELLGRLDRIDDSIRRGDADRKDQEDRLRALERAGGKR